MLLTLMLTSKGVAGVARASLVVLAATLGAYHLPLEGITLILGVDTLMDMARTTVNVIGNCLATVVDRALGGRARRAAARAAGSGLNADVADEERRLELLGVELSERDEDRRDRRAPDRRVGHAEVEDHAARRRHRRHARRRGDHELRVGRRGRSTRGARRW